MDVERGENMQQRIIIFGKTRKSAFFKLKEILKDIPDKDIYSTIRMSNSFKVVLKNGNRYRAVMFQEDYSYRDKYHYAYVDSQISIGEFYETILCCLDPTGSNKKKLFELY